MKTKKTLLALVCLAGLMGAIRCPAATIEGYAFYMRANSFTLFGSHLADFFGGPDLLDNMFPAPPPGSIVYKFTPPAGPYVASVYLGSGWIPNVRMAPGEAAWFYNPASYVYVAPIVGQTSCCPPPVLPVGPGFCMLAGSTFTGPVTGAMWADLTSSPEVDGMSIYTYGAGGFSIYTYSLALGGWDPVSPFPLAVGQGVFLLKP